MLAFGRKSYARELLKNRIKEIKVIVSLPYKNDLKIKNIQKVITNKRRVLTTIDILCDGFEGKMEEYNYENDRREKILYNTMNELTKQLNKYPDDKKIKETLDRFCIQNKKWLDEQARKNISLYDEDYYI